MLNYPIKFTPILHKRIWGGEKLHKILGKEKADGIIGESWEISTVPDSVSVVANGAFKGQNLQDLTSIYKEDFLGEAIYKKYGTSFPLLIKFIDAKTNLSVQLHPNDVLAKKRHNSFGKEEMWYIMQAEENAKLFFGFNKELTKESYLSYLQKGKLLEVLYDTVVKEGDIYHIPPGRVHSIGGGVMLAEVQQSSDITYRLFDWKRKDAQGKERELHTDLALDAIDFNSPEYFHTPYKIKNNEIIKVVSTPYFSTTILHLDKIIQKKELSRDSFTIYMCVGGKVSFETEMAKVTINRGETVLIPALLDSYSIVPDSDIAKLLIVHAV
jgi:mannose-6-phosphate isomerase